jgi:hypothetical protein
MGDLQAREEENMLKSLIFRVESDFGFRLEGVAMDFDKIERHVKARSSRLLKTSDSICTPELEVYLSCDTTDYILLQLQKKETRKPKPLLHVCSTSPPNEVGVNVANCCCGTDH